MHRSSGTLHGFATSYEQLIEAGNRIERHVQNLVAKK
jgi:hypothetical protein